MPRVSARSNKGTHSRRDDESYEDVIPTQSTLNGKDKVNPRKSSEDDPTYADDGQADENNNDDDHDGDHEEINCGPCGTTTENFDEDTDPYGDMIQCDKCNTWQHIKCMGLKKRSVPDDYICDECSGTPRPKINKRNSSVSSAAATGEPGAKRRKSSTTTKTTSRSSSGDQSPAPVDGPSKILQKLSDPTRISIAKAFYNFFKKTYPTKEGEDAVSEETKEDKVTSLALEIEDIIDREFPAKKTKAKYTDESRRVLFVLKKHFTNDIFAGKITLEDVVKKTPQEINEDIARIEQQNKENIKNIVLVEIEQDQIVRKTHKGDIIKENENEVIDHIDESIATRKVDHRRFSPDSSTAAATTKTQMKIIPPSIEQTAYNNANPRLGGDDFSSDNEHSDIQNAVSDYGSDIGEDANDDDEVGKEGRHGDNSHGRPKSNGNDDANIETKSTSSLSDAQTSETPDEERLGPILGVDSKTTSQVNSHSGDGADTKDAATTSSTTKQLVWRGSITFPDFAQFNADTKFYSTTDCESNTENAIQTAKNIFTESKYVIQGKLGRDRCDSYLNAIVSTRNLYIVQVFPTSNNHDDAFDKDKNQRHFDKLYHFLIKENRVGVLSGKPSFVKDSYLMPIDFRDPKLAQVLQNLKQGQEIGLFAVFVVQKNYTPRGSTAGAGASSARSNGHGNYGDSHRPSYARGGPSYSDVSSSSVPQVGHGDGNDGNDLHSILNQLQ
ncbi:BYE1 [Candida margitis]|uniref:BYE1 n=1 Tax=Candida margitis TaxID=1775924 RepID=UPI002225BE02|nr:BYE1 [Candida margitis]KAI5968987.1 BYE1 [Candida margitis]